MRLCSIGEQFGDGGVRRCMGFSGNWSTFPKYNMKDFYCLNCLQGQTETTDFDSTHLQRHVNKTYLQHSVNICLERVVD